MKPATPAPMVQVRIGRLVVDAGVDATRLDAAIRAALAQRLRAEPALRALAQPVADAVAPQVAERARRGTPR